MHKLILALSFTLAALTGAVAHADDSAPIEVKTIDGYSVKVSQAEIKAAYQQVVAAELENFEAMAALEQDLYTFAYDGSGLNMSNAEALAFASRVAKNIHDPKLLPTIKEAATFAYSSSGLNMSHSDAARFTESLSKVSVPAQRFAVFKKIVPLCLLQFGSEQERSRGGQGTLVRNPGIR